MWIKHRILIAASAAALGLLATVLLVPRVRFALLIAIGRNRCPIDLVWSVSKDGAAREALTGRLERAARVIRQDGAFVLWDVAGERYWVPAGSRILPAMLAEQRTEIYGSAGHIVRSGDFVLDCGANIGLSTLAALRRGAALVVAIEPAPDNVECLRRNLHSHIKEGRVVVYPKGVWDKDDVLPLSVQPSNSASYSVALRYRGAKPGPRVQLTTIDGIVRELNVERVDSIKMDIEGAERAALAGAAGTIRRFHPRLSIATEHRYDDPTAIPEMVRSLWDGYRPACGRCVEGGGGLRPAVMSFYAEP